MNTKKPLSGYSHYKEEVYDKLKAKNPKLTARKLEQLIKEQWDDLTDKKKQTYEKKAEKDQEIDGKETNESKGSKTKSKKKDKPEAPKFPLTAFFLYKEDVYPESRGDSEAEILSKIAMKWQYLDEVTLLKYEKRAEANRKEYEKDVREYEKKYGKIEKKKRRPPPIPPIDPYDEFMNDVARQYVDISSFLDEIWENQKDEYEENYKQAVKKYNRDLKDFKKEFGENSIKQKEIEIEESSGNEDEDDEDNEDKEDNNDNDDDDDDNDA